MGDERSDQEGAVGRQSFAAYREILAAYGFHPKRRFGQNFLLDPSLHRVLVESVAPQSRDLVLEVGPGLGFLTRELAKHSRVLAVEVDPTLVRVLRSELPSYPQGGSSVRLLHLDVLQRSRLNPELLEALAEELAGVRDGRFLLVANLPYAIAGPLIAELAILDSPPTEMAVLIQLELAQRLAASPGTREYGALSAQLQSAYVPRVLRKVPAQVFRPRPNVDSAMLHLAPREDGSLRLDAAERRELSTFLRQLFASRRKKLRNAKVLAPDLELAEQEAPELLEKRPDEVSPDDLVDLWNRLQNAR